MSTTIHQFRPWVKWQASVSSTVRLDTKTDGDKSSYQYKLGARLRGAAEEAFAAPEAICVIRQRAVRRTATRVDSSTVAFERTLVGCASKACEMSRRN
jgi:hypothetical protein